MCTHHTTPTAANDGGNSLADSNSTAKRKRLTKKQRKQRALEAFIHHRTVLRSEFRTLTELQRSYVIAALDTVSQAMREALDNETPNENESDSCKALLYELWKITDDAEELFELLGDLQTDAETAESEGDR